MNALKTSAPHVAPQRTGGESAAAPSVGTVTTASIQSVKIGGLLVKIAAHKIVAGIIALVITGSAVVGGVVITHKKAESKATTVNTEVSNYLSNTVTQGVDAEIIWACLTLTVRPPADTSHVIGYSLELLDSANPENNLHRQCDQTGKAYIQFETAGTYDRISVTSLLDTGDQGGIWQNDISINCTISSMPSYFSHYNVAGNRIITELSESGAMIVLFDISSLNAGTYTTINGDSGGLTYQNSNIVYLSSEDWAESFQEQLKSGSLYLRLRGWRYQTPVCDDKGISQMSVTYYDFGPHVPIPADEQTNDQP